MEKTYFTVHILTLAVCWCFLAKSSAQDDFIISRTINETNNERWHSSRDKFLIPDSVCKNSSNSNPCSLYQSLTPGRTCYCICPEIRPSFRFYSGKWGCTEDGALEKSEDCGFDWQGRPSGDLIAYFPPQSNTIFAKLEVGSQRSACQVNEAASSYLTCDGSWRPIGQEGAKSRFQLIYISSIQNVEEYELHITAGNGSADIRGRIVKLDLTCKPLTGRSCALLKVTGNVNCPVDPLKPTPLPTTTQHSSTQREEPLPPKVIGATQSTTEESFTGAKDENQDTQTPDVSSKNIVIIAAAVIAAIVVLLIISLLVVFLLHRQRKEDKSSPLPSVNKVTNSERKVPLEKKNTTEREHSNPIYERNSILKKAANVAVSQPKEPLSENTTGSTDTNSKSRVKPSPNTRKGKSKRKRKSRNVKGAVSSNTNYFRELTKKLSSTSDPLIDQSDDQQQAVATSDKDAVEFNDSDDYEFDGYAEDEWDSFSESEDEETKSFTPQERSSRIYATPEGKEKNGGNVRAMSSLHNAVYQNGGGSDHIYDRAEGVDGQKLMPNSGKNVSTGSLDSLVKSEGGDKKEDYVYDAPENIIIIK